MDRHLKGEREAPQLDHELCRFGIWLGTPRLARQGATPAFHTIEALHRQAHLLAGELCEPKSGGRRLEALQRLAKLHDLHSTILSHLTVIRQTSRP